MRNKFASVSEPNSFISDSGTSVKVLYSPIILEDGSFIIEESGEEDWQEYIDSFRDQTDMSYILARMAAGDESVLNQRTPMFGDFTVMPKTYAEALQLVIDREAQFMCLPLEVRNSFDNDFRKWFASSGSPEWLQKMDSVLVKSDGSLNENASDGVSGASKEEVKE